MADSALEIEMLALFSYKGAGSSIEMISVFDEESKQKKYVFTSTDLRQPLKDIFKENIAGTRRPKGILHAKLGKSARRHPFPENTTRSICDRVRITTDENIFKSNAETLAEMYCNAPKSQAAVLYIFKVRISGNDFLVIYSSEYTENIATFSTEEIIKSLTDVFSQELKKGILYPNLDSKGVPQKNEAKVYQKEYYADYWWEFLNLEKSESDEEILIREICEEEDRKGGKIEIDKAQVRTYTSTEPVKKKAHTTLVCDTVEIRMKFGDLYERVIPTKKDGQIRIVIIGERCFLRVTGFDPRDIKEYEDYAPI